jgi:hypothetical protein
LLVVAFSVAGCGGGSSPNGSGNGEASKPAQQVLADAVKAADAASSYHESGRLDPEASRFDRRVVKGKGFIGSATFGGQQKVDAVAIGSRGYMRANTAFWRLWEDRATAARLEGKWVALPASDRRFGLPTPEPSFDGLNSFTGTPTNKGATTYNGQSVVAIDKGSKSGTVYVAATGTPYPVAIVDPLGRSFTFDSWNKPVTLRPPPGAVDLSKLSG